MKVLVLGATGFIGFPVAQALSRAGHIVYGQTRSQEKASKLAAEEIYPIVCEPNSEAWHKLIPTLDVVIQAIGDRDLQDTQAIFDSIVSISKSLRPAGSPKITFIYTSGIVVHGEYRNEIVTDTTPITKPGGIAKGHALQEVAVRENQVFNGIVIRPGFVFGRSMVGSAFGAMLFDQVRKTGKVVWPGKPGGHLPVIHQDDLADMYVRAAEKGQLLGGQVFDGVNETTETTDGVLQRLVDVAGVKSPYEYREPQNVWDTALSTHGVIRPYLARSLLGWQSKKMGFADGMHLYYNTYLAITTASQ